MANQINPELLSKETLDRTQAWLNDHAGQDDTDLAIVAEQFQVLRAIAEQTQAEDDLNWLVGLVMRFDPNQQESN